MLTVLGGLAEFERDLIRARTGEGRARAVARGQRMGRPFRLTDHQKRAYVIADNQLALNAGWDRELLSLELGELKLGGFELALPSHALAGRP